LTDVYTASSIDEAVKDWGVPCKIITTHARPVEGAKHWTFQELRQQIRQPDEACFLLFGTGFGMTDETMRSFDGVLESIRGAPPLDFRHLSVRSAVSICLDRLMGPW
jgi:hypothetical protein